LKSGVPDTVQRVLLHETPVPKCRMSWIEKSRDARQNYGSIEMDMEHT